MLRTIMPFAMAATVVIASTNAYAQCCFFPRWNARYVSNCQPCSQVQQVVEEKYETETCAPCAKAEKVIESVQPTCSNGVCSTSNDLRYGWYSYGGRTYYGYYRLKKQEEPKIEEPKEQLDEFVPDFGEEEVDCELDLNETERKAFNESDFLQDVYGIVCSDESNEEKGRKISKLADSNAKELRLLDRVCLFNRIASVLMTVEEKDAFDRANDVRKRYRLFPLFVDFRLTFAARSHSVNMDRGGWFSHYSGYSSPWSRAQSQGTSCSAENIAGTGNGKYSALMWERSSGHLTNILGSHRRMGVGGSAGKMTQMFGR